MRRAWLLLLAVACAEPSPNDALDPVPDVAGVRFERMFLTTGSGGRFGGFDDAVRPGATVRLFLRGDAYEVTADEDGRLDYALDVATGESVEVEAEGTRVAFVARDPAAARRAAVRGPIGGTGDVPNDLLIVDPASGARGIVVRSADHAISSFDLELGLRDGVRLPRVADQVATPWFAAPIDDTGERFAVTAQSQHLVYIVNLANGRIEHALTTPVTPLDEPFELARPVDIDRDGTPDTTLTETPALAPQPVMATDDHLIAAFSGFVEQGLGPQRPPVFVPAVLAVWSLDDLDAAPDVYVLPTMNPQEIRRREDGRVSIVCSGVVDLRTGARATSAGGVEVFDLESRTFVEHYDFGLFAPTTALFLADRVWVGSLSTARLIGRSLVDAQDTVMLDLTGVDEVNSVFRLVDLGGGLIAAPTFNRDELFIVDARTAELNPAPFFAPLLVGAGAPVFDGLQIVARRPGRPGVDFVGPDLYAMFGIAARVSALELRRILGP